MKSQLRTTAGMQFATLTKPLWASHTRRTLYKFAPPKNEEVK